VGLFRDAAITPEETVLIGSVQIEPDCISWIYDVGRAGVVLDAFMPVLPDKTGLLQYGPARSWIRQVAAAAFLEAFRGVPFAIQTIDYVDE